MSKTAEEILSEHFQRSIPENIPRWNTVINGAKEFAAQEVEAYKTLLKEKIKECKNTGFTCREGDAYDDGLDRAIELIDTVK